MQYQFLAGVDWATETDQVCVIDATERVLSERRVAHTGDGIAQFVNWLLGLAGGDGGAIAVGIEMPRGALIDALVERGVHVYSLNPKQLDRFRDRHTVAGAKDDRRDAFVLATSLRSDLRLFRRVGTDDPVTIELRETVRMYDDLRQDLGRDANRLRDQLHRYFEQALSLCPSADEPWFWSLLGRVSSPAAVPRIRLRHIAGILQEHRIRRITAQEVLDRLKTRPLPTAPGVAEAASRHVKVLLARLELTHQQKAECGQRMETLLEQLPAGEDRLGQKTEHRDVDIVQSLPGVGPIVSATVFAEASQLLRSRDYHGCRAIAGIAPVTKRTGKQGQPGSRRRIQVTMRRACNVRLRNALYYWSAAAARTDVRCREQYARLRRDGHEHGRALRSVGDRLLRILFALLRSGTLYDPSRFVPNPLVTA